MVVFHQQEKDHAISIAREKTLLILNRNLATHLYFNHDLKPKLFEFLDGQMDWDYFDPVWMSSTFAVREIDDYFRELSNFDAYYYKEAAINARSPENEADEFEREFLEQLNEDETLNEVSDVLEIDGAPYFVTMIRGEVMEETCLRCHSDPETAPAGLLEIYGDENSFNRSEDEVVSVISIRIPLAAAYVNVTRDTVSTGVILIVGFIGMFIFLQYLQQRLLENPIKKIQEKASRIARYETDLGEPIVINAGKEFQEVATAVNIMSTNLQLYFSTLDFRIKKDLTLLKTLPPYELLKNNNLMAAILFKVFYDEQGNLVDIVFVESNKIFEKITGYSEEFVKGHSFAKIFPEYENRSIHKDIAQILKDNKESIQVELSFPSVGLITQALVFSEMEDHITVLMTDITERYHEELELELSKTAVDNAFHGIFFVEKSGIFTYVNQLGSDLSGFSREEMIGMHVWDVDMSMPKEVRKEFWELLKQEKELVFESILRNKKGELYPAMISSTYVQFRGEEYELAFLEDLSERRKSEETLRRWANIYENASWGIAVTEGVSEELSMINQAFADMYGYDLVYLREKPISMLVPEEAKYDFQQAISKADESGSVKFETYHHRQNGERFPVQVNIVSVKDVDGIVTYRVFNIEDISDRKKTQQALLSAQKIASLGTLAAGVAHEINSPLQIITGLTGRMINKFRNGDMQEDRLGDNLENINRNAWRVANIIRSLLAYSRSSMTEIEEHDLSDIVDDTLLLIEHQLRSWSNIKVETNLSRSMPKLQCERNSLIQVFINLMNNARDAMPKGGTITIITHYDSSEKQHVVQVSDTGSGISETELKNIFDPFFTTKPVGKGTGLGLSIVKGIIDSHGGEIEVESKLKEGTTIRILFPEIPLSMEERNKGSQGRYKE